MINEGNKLTFFKFPEGILDLDPEGYLCKNTDANTQVNKHVHNPEWYIQQKINDNEEGYFDFSKSCVDVGSCYGVYIFTTKFSHYYAFEPSKYTRYILQANLALKDLMDKVDVYDSVLSNRNGMIDFNGFEVRQPDKIFPDHDLVYHDHDEDGKIVFTQHPCRTMDIYSLWTRPNPEIGFIKIDMEGTELDVLHGAYNTIINSHYPPILFECWKQFEQNKKDIFSYLEGLGYTILENWGDDENHLAVHEKI